DRPVRRTQKKARLVLPDKFLPDKFHNLIAKSRIGIAAHSRRECLPGGNSGKSHYVFALIVVIVQNQVSGNRSASPKSPEQIRYFSAGRQGGGYNGQFIPDRRWCGPRRVKSRFWRDSQRWSDGAVSLGHPIATS